MARAVYIIHAARTARKESIMGLAFAHTEQTPLTSWQAISFRKRRFCIALIHILNINNVFHYT